MLFREDKHYKESQEEAGFLRSSLHWGRLPVLIHKQTFCGFVVVVSKRYEEGVWCLKDKERGGGRKDGERGREEEEDKEEEE